MGLKIAQKLRESTFKGSSTKSDACSVGIGDLKEINAFPTRADTAPTESQTNKSANPTIRHIRQHEQVANDDSNGFVTNEGMPTHFFNGGYHGWRFGDREWIAGKLRRVRCKAERIKLAAEYAQRYKTIHDAEPIEHKKDGKARFTVNSWLLKTTK